MTPVRVIFGTYRDSRAEPEGTHALRLRLDRPGAREYYFLECQEGDLAPEPLKAVRGFAAALLGVMKLDQDYVAMLDQDDNYTLLEIRPIATYIRP